MPGTMLKSGAIAGRAAIVSDASGTRAADVGDRRQRHDGVAEPVRSEDDKPGHGGLHEGPGRCRAGDPHVRLK